MRLLYETGSIDEHTQIWWSVRPHLAYPTVEIRICDGQPDLAESRALAALGYALAARIARATTRASSCPDPTARMIEENMWRAIRYGLSGELLDLGACEVRPARAELERVAEWVAPGRRRARRSRSDDPGGERGRAPDRARRGGLDARGDLRGAGRSRGRRGAR